VTPKFTPDEMRAQVNKMWLRLYPAGPTDETWILNVGIGAGMLSLAADRIAELEAAALTESLTYTALHYTGEGPLPICDACGHSAQAHSPPNYGRCPSGAVE
jgi:hypothetical protein